MYYGILKYNYCYFFFLLSLECGTFLSFHEVITLDSFKGVRTLYHLAIITNLSKYV